MRRFNDLAEGIVVARMAESGGHYKASNRNVVSFGDHNVSLACFCVHVSVVNNDVTFALKS